MSKEQEILTLIAQDRLDIPLSSMDNKLRRARSGLAQTIAESLGDTRFKGNRVYAFVEEEDKQKARGMKEAIEEFVAEYPKYGAILAGKIAEKRTMREKHLYFGVNPNCKLTSGDYIEVMKSLGLSEASSRGLYPSLMEVSRKLANARDEERSVIVGKYNPDE